MAMVLRLISGAVLLAILGGCSGVFFYPMKPWAQNPARQGLDYQDVVLIQPDGLRLHGWWLPARGFNRGTVYFLHGNAENISTHLINVQWLPARGYNVFLLDYRGYGLSEGDPDLPGALADVQLGLDWLSHSGRLQGKPLVLFGQSLGGALGVDVLADPANQGKVDCVMLEATFASYRGVADDVMRRSWLLWPLRWAVLPTLPAPALDPAGNIAALAPRPLLLLHSHQDPVIPYAQGEALFAAAAEPKTFQALKGGHAQGTRDPAVQQRLLDFLDHSGCMAEPPEQPGMAEPAQPGMPTPRHRGVDSENASGDADALRAPAEAYRF
ncbi:alpha/beta hydrolase [Alloalcanivorax mobilis]|uniref:alpha/beta hydrolase n=1 Tax=Alloalcanivorax mobilis TaxID=2019569 RepID=UPI001E52730F|nr:alpha/beta fold hydrolase [Alloalcanivorax mobilis]